MKKCFSPHCKSPQSLFCVPMTIPAPKTAPLTPTQTHTLSKNEKKTPKERSRNTLIMALRQERCQCQYEGCTMSSVTKTRGETAADVELAEWCSMLQNTQMLIIGVGWKNASLDNKQSGQAMQEGLANRDFVSRLSNSVISDWNKSQQCATHYGPAVRILPNLIIIHWRRKKEESRKII